MVFNPVHKSARNMTSIPPALYRFSGSYMYATKLLDVVFNPAHTLHFGCTPSHRPYTDFIAPQGPEDNGFDGPLKTHITIFIEDIYQLILKI